MAKSNPSCAYPAPSPLSNKERERYPDGRRRRKRLPQNSIVPLTEGNPIRMRYAPDGTEGDFRSGVRLLSGLAKDRPVYLVRRQSPSCIAAGQGELQHLMCRMPWDRITARHLVPGVTVYAVRTHVPEGPVLIVVDPVALDWRQRQ